MEELELEIQRLRTENAILKLQTPEFKFKCKHIATHCMLIDGNTKNVIHTFLKPTDIYKDGDCIKIVF